MKVADVAEAVQNEQCLLPEAGLQFLGKIVRGETDGITCWRSEAVERRAGSQIEGVGLFATEDIAEATVVAIKQGHEVDSRTIKDNADIIRGTHQQIGRDRFITGLTPEEVDKNLVGYNHSCDPNARVLLFRAWPIAILATRKAVIKGDELTVDYSVSQMSDTHLIKACRCGSPECRGVIMPGSDWKKQPDIQQRYQAELPWFLQDAIAEDEALLQGQTKAT